MSPRTSFMAYDPSRLPRRMQSKIHVAETGCWEWQAALNNGYGVITFARKQYYAHRVTYLALAGAIAEGLQIDHLCRNRRCCNPDHLEPVTSRTNNRRCPSVFKSHCKRGHSLVGDNLIDGFQSLPAVDGTPSIRRACRTCSREADRRYKERQRQRNNDIQLGISA